MKLTFVFHEIFMRDQNEKQIWYVKEKMYKRSLFSSIFLLEFDSSIIKKILKS